MVAGEILHWTGVHALVARGWTRIRLPSAHQAVLLPLIDWIDASRACVSKQYTLLQRMTKDGQLTVSSGNGRVIEDLQGVSMTTYHRLSSSRLSEGSTKPIHSTP